MHQLAENRNKIRRAHDMCNHHKHEYVLNAAHLHQIILKIKLLPDKANSSVCLCLKPRPQPPTTAQKHFSKPQASSRLRTALGKRSARCPPQPQQPQQCKAWIWGHWSTWQADRGLLACFSLLSLEKNVVNAVSLMQVIPTCSQQNL